MHAWLRLLLVLAASLSIALLPLGCLGSPPPDASDGSGGGSQGPDQGGGQGSDQGGSQGPGQGDVGGQRPEGRDSSPPDWDALLAGLPEASFEGFWDYVGAVAGAVRAAYSGNPHLTVGFESPPDGVPGYCFAYVWRRFEQENHVGVDPEDCAAYARVDFWVDPAEGEAPCLAHIVRGDEDMGWSSDEDVGATREAALGMWRGLLAGYSAVGPTFWEAFTTLHQVGATGQLAGAGGEFLLPGPEGYDTSVWFRASADEERCSIIALVSYAPEGAFPSKPEDWGTLVSTLPRPGLGRELQAYVESIVAALRRASAGQDVIVAQTGMGSPADAKEKWEQKTFTWLRFPVAEGDPGYVLETLTVRLTPGPAGAALPLAKSMTVTELVAWDPMSYDSPRDFQTLIPARDLFLESYLSVGDGFLEAFEGLKLTTGLTQELPGPDGAKVQLTVEEVSQEDAALRVRYTLTYAGS